MVQEIKSEVKIYGIRDSNYSKNEWDIRHTDHGPPLPSAPYPYSMGVITSLFQVALNDTLLNTALTLIAAESCLRSISYNLEMRKLKI